MSKLYLNKDSVKNNVITNINTAIDKVSNAIYWIGALNIPSDFEYAYYLKQINDKNDSLITQLTTIKDLLNEDINNYKQIEKTNESNFSNISILKVSKRKGLSE